MTQPTQGEKAIYTLLHHFTVWLYQSDNAVFKDIEKRGPGDYVNEFIKFVNEKINASEKPVQQHTANEAEK